MKYMLLYADESHAPAPLRYSRRVAVEPWIGPIASTTTVRVQEGKR